jgi:hypothetical protein
LFCANDPEWALICSVIHDRCTLQESRVRGVFSMERRFGFKLRKVSAFDLQKTRHLSIGESRMSSLQRQTCGQTTGLKAQGNPQ